MRIKNNLKKSAYFSALLIVLTTAFTSCSTKRLSNESNIANEHPMYEEYFTPNTMRYDFYHCGNSSKEYYTFDCIKREGAWAGSRNALINPFNYGEQHFRIIDATSGKVIYKNNYCTLFNEWQTTPEATEAERSFPEALIFPEPKNDFYIEIYARNKETKEMEKKFSHLIHLNSHYIEPYRAQYESIDIHIGGDIEHSLDIVLLPDGFTSNEKDKFIASCIMWQNALFNYAPFTQNRHRINIRAVWAASPQSGISEPGNDKWINTLLDTRFFTFKSERYQMTEEFQRVRDIAANAPYESIFILTNTDKYGGGGIYNF